MGIDDRSADLQTIEKLRTRVDLLVKVKEDLLAANKELQTQLQQLRLEIVNREYERDCLILEVKYLRDKLESDIN